jgi:hypothetical protein
MDRAKLIDVAVGLNENYRSEMSDLYKMELGFLYGTAEFVTALTLQKDESYCEVREEIARKIDQEAQKTTYPLLLKE